MDSPILPPILSGANVVIRHLPLVPEIRLYLLDDDYPTQNLAHEDFVRLMSRPPYWAFCWGGGQALARWILDNPAYVAGRCVVDFGAGSGVAGVAAALAGAAETLALDIDEDALRLCAINAQLNQVCIKTHKTDTDIGRSTLLAADVCYEGEGFDTVSQHLQAGGELLLAESRLRDLSSVLPQLQKIAQYRTRTYPDLDESDRYDQVDVYSSYIL